MKKKRTIDGFLKDELLTCSQNQTTDITCETAWLLKQTHLNTCSQISRNKLLLLIKLLPLKNLYDTISCVFMSLVMSNLLLFSEQVPMQVRLQEKLRKNFLKWHSDLDGWIAGGFLFFYSQHIVRYPQRSATAHNILLLKPCWPTNWPLKDTHSGWPHQPLPHTHTPVT